MHTFERSMHVFLLFLSIYVTHFTEILKLKSLRPSLKGVESLEGFVFMFNKSEGHSYKLDWQKTEKQQIGHFFA